MTNFELVQNIFFYLKRMQVQAVVLCAGARNAALIMHLPENEFQIYHYFEERSASFFALGLAKANNQPVAIVTTSGTAVAELLPAVIESFYQGIPLLVVTADRPKKYRGSGAPQAIEQVGLFSSYVEQVYDIDIDTNDFNLTWSKTKPLQLNVCFDEPLIEKLQDQDKFEIVEKIKNSHRSIEFDNQKSAFIEMNEIVIPQPLIIIGQLSSHEIQEVVSFLRRTTTFLYIESLSQLKGVSEFNERLLNSSEQLINKYFNEKHFSSVIRIGGVPTLRFWRDLENKYKDVPVYNFSNLKFTGLSRTTFHYNIGGLKSVLILNDSDRVIQEIKSTEVRLQKLKLELIKKYPLSEPSWVNFLSLEIENQPLYLGNSLPIRHWDQFTLSPHQNVFANRGANGIDGQISTYLGWSEAFKKSYCLIGDLTTMYDLASLGLANQLCKGQRIIIIINNFGGQIFNKVIKKSNKTDIFLNTHPIEFENWAKMWGWEYKKWIKAQDLNFINGVNQIIEIQPDAKQTESFWNEWDQICQKI